MSKLRVLILALVLFLAHLSATLESTRATPSTLKPNKAKLHSRKRQLSFDNKRDRYEAKCFISRKIHSRDGPTVYFHSRKSHSNETLGCRGDKSKSVKLNNLNRDKSQQPKLDTQMIRRELLDTKLFQANLTTYLIVHGFMASWNSNPWTCRIKDFVLDNTDANVFIVDWSVDSRPLLLIDYGAAVANTQVVGEILGEFINQLVRLSGQRDAHSYHMIGHSLGAHICGFAGYQVKTLGRITGLDPAGPCFRSSSVAVQHIASQNGFLGDGRRRLSPQSANFVLALHSDTGLFGLNENCAHYDVYLNGGASQPDCQANSPKDLARHLDLLSKFNWDIYCSHAYVEKLLDKFQFDDEIRCERLEKRNTRLFDGFGDSDYERRTKNEEDEKDDDEEDERKEAEEDEVEQREDLSTNTASKCYPMAYECVNWQAFKAGECGFCRDNDSRCVFIGLGLSYGNRTENTNKLCEKATRRSDEESEAASTLLADDDDEHNELVHTRKHASQLEEEPEDELGLRRHYIHSGAGSATCLYHYQVIIAVDKENERAKKVLQEADKHPFYLQIPLDGSGLLADPMKKAERTDERLIKISHTFAAKSGSLNHLSSGHVDAIGRRHFNMSKSESMSRDRIEFHTALITFGQAPRKWCESDTGGAGGAALRLPDKENDDSDWQICEPLNALDEARLWSSKKLMLDATVWVSLNYMSGLDYETRLANSYVFSRDQRRVVASEKAVKVKLKTKSANPLDNIGCWLGVFKMSGKIASCKRDYVLDSMRYYVDLRAINLGQLG